jgi:hypothetical protein
MQNRAAVLAIAIAVTTLVACGDDNDSTEPNLLPNVTYRATLRGANERPTPVTSNGQGEFVGTYNPNTGLMSYTVTYSGLGTNSTLAHIHCCVSADVAGPVAYDFSRNGNVLFTPGTTSGSFNGVILLTTATAITTAITGDSLRKAMDAGLTYVNVHSSQFGGGEIRGQIVKQ